MLQTFILKTYRGDTPVWPMTFTQRDAAGVKTALPLTDSTLIFTAKTALTEDDSAAVLQKTLAPADHVDAAAGLTQLTLESADTMLPVGVYHCDIKRITADGGVLTLAVGQLHIYQPVTHAVTTGSA